MKTNNLDGNKILEWISKALLGVLTFFVQSIYHDVKEMREQFPAMKVEIDNLKDQELIKRFKSMKIAWDMKDEETITYDSLKNRTL